MFLNAKGKEEWHCKFYLANYKIIRGMCTIADYLETYNIKSNSIANARAKNI